MAYKKLESLQYLMDLGLNVHKFKATGDTYGILKAVKAFDNVCTIRTDSLIETYDLPFYIIENDTSNLENICGEIKEKDLIAIVANGLKYDDKLMYNLVYTINRNGDFWIEYSVEKCTLREMYKRPVNCYIGNIDQRVWNWKTIRETEDRVDKRNIRQLMREL